MSIQRVVALATLPLRRSIVRLPIVLSICTFALFLGCDQPAPPTQQDAADEMTVSIDGEHSNPLLGKRLEPFTTVDPDGNTVDLSKHLGKEVILLDFWASWCAPCRAQSPVLERVAKQFGADKLRVLGVGTSDERAAITRFLSNNTLGYSSVFDDQDVASSLYQVRSLPTLVLIAKDGTVKAVATGFVNESELSRLVRDTLMVGPGNSSRSVSWTYVTSRSRYSLPSAVPSTGVGISKSPGPIP